MTDSTLRDIALLFDHRDADDLTDTERRVADRLVVAGYLRIETDDMYDWETGKMIISYDVYVLTSKS